MITKPTATRRLRAAALSAALAAMGTTAMAAQTAPQRVQVQADEFTTVTVQHSRTGMENAQVSQRVSYADLDISTRRGAHELTNRIERSATYVCERLNALYPEGSFVTQWQNERICVGDATLGAMEQAKVAIASAKQQGDVR